MSRINYKKTCICNQLRSGEKESVDIVDGDTGKYVGLTMELGTITAHGEDNAYSYINFCPFCGREFKNKTNN